LEDRRSRQYIEDFLSRYDNPGCFGFFNKHKRNCLKCDFKDRCRIESSRRNRPHGSRRDSSRVLRRRRD